MKNRDTATSALVGTIPVGFIASGVAVGGKSPVTSFGPYAYVANTFDDTVSVIFTVTNTTVATIKVGNNPGFVALSPDGAFAYVGNAYDGTVSVIDTASRVVVHTIAIGDEPHGLVVSPDGKYVYVSDGSGRTTVSVIDTATNAVVGSPLTAGFFPIAVAVSGDGSLVYVVNVVDNTVSVLYTGNWVTAV